MAREKIRHLLFKVLSLKGEGVYWLWEAPFDSGPDLVNSE